MYLHVCRKFELIPIKIRFLNLLKNQAKDPVLNSTEVFGQISSKITRREFFIFITFSDTHTCTYVV